MEEITKMHVDWKKITVVGALVLLTALTVGGLTWYVADNGSQNELEAYKNEIATLQTEVAQLKADVLDTSSQNLDATTKLEKYSNSTFNFSLSYPSDWVLEDNLPKTNPPTSDANQELRIKKGNSNFTFYINPGGWGAECSFPVISYKSEMTDSAIILGSRTISPESVREDFQTCGYIISTSAKKQSTSYLISMMGDEAELARDELIYKQIVSSLKFN